MVIHSTNFDTFIATTNKKNELARRGHAKSKRADLRVVGLAVLVSETGHVPLLHRTYPGNQSDQGVLSDCLGGLEALHNRLNEGSVKREVARTVVRDGGFWSEQLELDLEEAGYGSIISLPLQHAAAQRALDNASGPRVMKALKGKLKAVRAARTRGKVGELSRTLVVVESEALLKGQKRGIAVALRKAKRDLDKLARRAAKGRIQREKLENGIQKALRREHLSHFVVTQIHEKNGELTLKYWVDPSKRRHLERTRLGKRVLCTDRHTWSTERIVAGFRGQWNVEELFRRAKKGGVVAWGPSHQWADSSLRFHTFATVLGLMLVSLAKLALGTKLSAKSMMTSLASLEATLARVATGKPGRRPTALLLPDLTPLHKRAIKSFNLQAWLPSISSTMCEDRPQPDNSRAA